MVGVLLALNHGALAWVLPQDAASSLVWQFVFVSSMSAEFVCIRSHAFTVGLPAQQLPCITWDIKHASCALIVPDIFDLSGTHSKPSSPFHISWTTCFFR